jgi:signal transduction histidine kinase
VNRAFAAFAAAMALWTAKDILFWVLHPWFTADAWVGASLLLALALQLTFLGLRQRLPRARAARPPRGRRRARAARRCFVPLVATGRCWSRATASDADGRFVIELDGWMWAFGAYVLALYGAGIGVLARSGGLARGRSRAAARAVVVVAGTAGALMLLVNVVLPLAGSTRPLTYSSLIVLAGALCYAYAIGSVRLFSIASVLDPLRLFPLTSKIALVIAGAGLLGFLVLGIPVVRLSFGPREPDEWERFVVLSVMTGPDPDARDDRAHRTRRLAARAALTEAAVEVTNGRYGTQVEGLRSNDEIGVLAEAFNAMSVRVARDIEQLGTINEGLVRTEKLATAGVLAAGRRPRGQQPARPPSRRSCRRCARAAVASEDRETLETILGEISRISAILRDLTEFARAPAPRRAPSELNPIVEACLRLVAVDRRFKRLRIETDLAHELPSVSIDADQMQQVFLNLILNAGDATPEGGRIRVASRFDAALGRRRRGLRHRLRHPPDVRRHVFDPFFTTKPPGQGTGLGLSVCYGIVSAPRRHDRHRERAGRGHDRARALPVVPRRETSSPHDRDDPRGRGRGAACARSSRALRGRGLPRRPAATGREALERFGAEPSTSS